MNAGIVNIQPKVDPFYSLYEDGDMMLVDDVRILQSPEGVHFHRNVIAFCSKGRFTAEHNGSRILIHEGEVFICPPGSQISDVMVSPDFEFLAMAVSNVTLERYMRGDIRIWNYLSYIDRINILPVESSDGLRFIQIFQDLLRLLCGQSDDSQDARDRQEMLKVTMHIGLIAFSIMLRRQANAEANNDGLRQNVSYFSQFLNLLQHSEHKHQTVDYYASELCISTKYLTDICKKNSGKTAGQWIREYVLADITYYLQHTDLSIKVIASKMGFSSTSFFGKYVKDALGCTPMEYRNKRQ